MDSAHDSRSLRIKRLVAQAARTDEELGVGVISAGILALFLVIFIPSGLLIAVATAMVMLFVWLALGGPTGTVATILAVAWLGGTLALLFVLFRKLYRRLPRQLKAPSETFDAWSYEARPDADRSSRSTRSPSTNRSVGTKP